MKTIIAGSRGITDFAVLLEAVEKCNFEITSVVSGRAAGVDYLGELYAEQNNLPLHKYPAEWNKYGRSAGPIRNKLMSENAEALLAIWDGNSAGTKNMIDNAKAKGLTIYVHMI